MPASRLTLDSSEDVVLEVRDENGNVSSNAESLRGLLHLLRDDDRLLVNLLEHIVAMIALGDQFAGHAGDRHRAFDGIIVLVENLRPFAGDDDPVAFLKIGDALGQRRKGEGIRPQIGLTVAITDDQR